jgi:hypothetical protein
MLHPLSIRKSLSTEIFRREAAVGHSGTSVYGKKGTGEKGTGCFSIMQPVPFALPNNIELCIFNIFFD